MKSVQNLITSLLFITFLIALQGCKKNRWEVDTSKVSLEIKLNRFENQLLALTDQNYAQGLKGLRSRYPDIIEAYTQYIFQLAPGDTQKADQVFRHYFIQKPYMDSLKRDVDGVFSPKVIDSVESELTSSFKRIHYFLPRDTIPRFSTVLTGFGYQTFTFNHELCIGLDLFLGRNYRFYRAQNVEYAEYQIRRIEKPYLLPQVLKSYFGSKYDQSELTDRSLLSAMIYAGKQLYFCDVMAPNLADTLKTEYTTAQLKWCGEYEADIFKHFAGKNIFYSTDQGNRITYLSDGPFTNADGLPNTSAPRLGEWIGWQIVKSYMDKNPDVSLEQLFREKDAQMLFKKSRYKPK